MNTPQMELVIGPPPHLRCACGWVFTFHHKTKIITMEWMQSLVNAHSTSPAHEENDV